MTIENGRTFRNMAWNEGDVAVNYPVHQSNNIRARLIESREKALLASALGTCEGVRSILDLPCGAGRFWPVFERSGISQLIAADMSQAMLEVAGANPPQVPDFSCRQLNGFSIDLPQNAVDFTSCQEFLHNISNRDDRMLALRELHRVSQSYVAVSLWVDGNIGSIGYKGKAQNTSARGYGSSLCRQRTDAEKEFLETGFSVLRHYDAWPGFSMRRLYLLGVR